MDSSYQGTRNGEVVASASMRGGIADQPHLSDDEFLAALEAGMLPERCFDHAAHVRAGYLYLQRLPFPPAAAAMCASVANYARALGKPERYHETVTIGYMTLIHAQLWQQREAAGWERFRKRARASC